MIKNQSNNLVAEYRYNGLNQRLSWHYDTDADGDCDSNDKTYYFAYDDQWRVVATFRDSDTSPKERFLYHAAGLGGYGGAGGGIGGYIDHVIFRDRDINSGWTSASDGTLEERMYYCQNWRADVSAILTSAGKMVEWIKYSAYGTPTALPTGDTDSDGDFDLTDLGNMGGGYEIRKDAELDGDIDANDINYAIANGYQTLGRGVLSSSYVGNRKGYAGYENDGAIARFAHVRNRVFDSTLGRWTRRDPLGYVDGLGLYEYVGAMAITFADYSGLHRQPGACYACPDGAGYQRSNPTSQCDICCTEACNRTPTIAGTTVCCGKTATACVCSVNVRRLANATDDCIVDAMAACTLAHEAFHVKAIDCSTNPDCDLRTNRSTKDGLPWRRVCDGPCTECDAWNFNERCFNDINCNRCPDPAECTRVVNTRLQQVPGQVQHHCNACDECLRRHPGNPPVGPGRPAWR